MCYTLLIAAAAEMECGIDNIWKMGASDGCHDYTNFGKYITRNWFRCFCAAAPFVWCEKIGFWIRGTGHGIYS